MKSISPHLCPYLLPFVIDPLAPGGHLTSSDVSFWQIIHSFQLISILTEVKNTINQIEIFITKKTPLLISRLNFPMIDILQKTNKLFRNSNRPVLVQPKMLSAPKMLSSPMIAHIQWHLSDKTDKTIKYSPAKWSYFTGGLNSEVILAILSKSVSVECWSYFTGGLIFHMVLSTGFTVLAM